MTEWQLLNHMRQRLLLIRAEAPTTSSPSFMEKLDEMIRLYDDALHAYVTRHDITLDVSDPNQQAFQFFGAPSHKTFH